MATSLHWPWKVLEFLEFFPRVYTLIVENLAVLERSLSKSQFPISKTKNYSRPRNCSILEKSRSEFTRPTIRRTFAGGFAYHIWAILVAALSRTLSICLSLEYVVFP